MPMLQILNVVICNTMEMGNSDFFTLQITVTMVTALNDFLIIMYLQSKCVQVIKIETHNQIL